MFLVFGFRVLWRTIAEGRFRCPHEGTEQPFRRQLGRRWFTVFFVVPIVPLKEVGESVQCTSCRRRFSVDTVGQSASGAWTGGSPGAATTGSASASTTLSAGGSSPVSSPPGITAETGELLSLSSHAIRVAVAGLLRAEGQPDQRARLTAVKAVRANQTSPYDDAALEVDLADLVTPPEELLWPLAAQLDRRGKERFLEACLEALGKPATLTTNQRAGMDRLGRALGLADDDIAAVIATVAASSR